MDMDDEELARELGREPRLSEVAERMELTPEAITEALEATRYLTSIHEEIYQDDGDAIYVMDQVKDDRVSEEEWVRDLSIKQALSKLQKREQNIIRKRYFQGRTQMEVAEEIGISQAQVSRLEKNVINRIKGKK